MIVNTWLIGNQWKQKAGLGRKMKAIGERLASASLYGKGVLLISKFKAKGIACFV